MLRKKIIQLSCFTVILTISTLGFTHNKVVVVPLGGSDSQDRNNILYGRALSSTDQALLFEWPGTGVEVRTRSIAAGDAIFEVRIVNTNPPGGPSFRVTDVSNSSTATLNPVSSLDRGGLAGSNLLLTENNGSLGRMMRLNCFANVIAGGDDQFIQCMGVIAGDP